MFRITNVFTARYEAIVFIGNDASLIFPYHTHIKVPYSGGNPQCISHNR